MKEDFMLKKRSLALVLTLFIIISLSGGLAAARGGDTTPLKAALGTAFTYQGQLKDGSGNPVTSTCEFIFSLWDDPVLGAKVGTRITKSGVTVNNGLFTVSLDFGPSAFTGSARWLQIVVMCASDSVLSPRQELTPAPYALYSINSGSLNGQTGTYYRNASNINTGTLGTGYYSAYSDLSAEGYLGTRPVTWLNNSTLQTNLNADQLDGVHASSFQRKYDNLVVVAKSGGDYTTITAALNSITDANCEQPLPGLRGAGHLLGTGDHEVLCGYRRGRRRDHNNHLCWQSDHGHGYRGGSQRLPNCVS